MSRRSQFALTNIIICAVVTAVMELSAAEPPNSNAAPSRGPVVRIDSTDRKVITALLARDRSKAVVLMSNQRDGKAGHGALYILSRDRNRWHVTGILGLWVS